MTQRYVIIDVETTGNVPKKGDRIIQIGVVVVQNEKITETFSSYVNPNKHIPPFIEQLTGISNETVANAPSFSEIADKIVSLLQGAYFIAHNVPFDLSFIQAELEQANQPPFQGSTIDTVELSRLVFPTKESFKLSDLAPSLQIEHKNPHQADSDALVTAKLFLHIKKKLQDLPLPTLEQLAKRETKLQSSIGHVLRKIIDKRLERAKEKSYLLVHGIAVRKQIDTPLSTMEESFTFLDWKESSQKFAIENYEQRPEQQEMMEIVNTALQTNQYAMIEAGTGIGKSLAYLLPGLLFAKEHGHAFVVSTHTLQLQRQLLEKDIPILTNSLPFSFTTVLLKGRRNYMDLHKFSDSLQEEDENYDETLTKCQLLVWLTETTTGDIDEVSLPSGGRNFWSGVERRKQNHNERFDFFSLAENRAKQADIIITNHAFLVQHMHDKFTNDFQYIVIDEAHHLEEIALRYFGKKLDYTDFRSIISRIGKIEQHNSLAKLYAQHQEEQVLFTKIETILFDIELEVDTLFRMLKQEVLQKTGTSHTRIRTLFSVTQPIIHLVERVVELAKVFQQLLKKIIPTPKSEDYLEDCYLLPAFCFGIEEILISKDKRFVHFVETEAKSAVNGISLCEQPLEFGGMLTDNFFAKKQSVILTSATLTVNGAFDYMISQLGLNDFYPIQASIASSFAYEEQTCILIPSDLPSIKESTVDEFSHAIAIQLFDIAEKTKGKMLVLFTSYEILRATYTCVKEMNFDERFSLIAQGVSSGSTTKLVRTFRQMDEAILFGTSSFWEGVDLPEENLSCIVIVRLPFSPPTDPFFVVKSKQVKALGGNPFYDVSLPKAILRFKQGFGRLIRSKNHKGVIFVFDKRITQSSYGNQFLQSIPKVRVYEEPLSLLLYRVEEWLK